MTIGWFWGNTFILTPHHWLALRKRVLRSALQRSDYEVNALKRALWSPPYVCLHLIHFHTVQMWLLQLKTVTEREKTSLWKDNYWNRSLRDENSAIVHPLMSFQTGFRWHEGLNDQNFYFWMNCHFKTHMIKLWAHGEFFIYHRISSSILLSALGGHPTPPYTETTPSINTELSTRCTSDGVWQIFLLSSNPAETALNTASEFN